MNVSPTCEPWAHCGSVEAYFDKTNSPWIGLRGEPSLFSSERATPTQSSMARAHTRVYSWLYVQYCSSNMQCRSLRLTMCIWRTVLNIRKSKHARNSTLSLSVVIVVAEIFHKFHDNDTVSSNYDDKTAILLFLRAFKLFSQQFWLF